MYHRMTEEVFEYDDSHPSMYLCDTVLIKQEPGLDTCSKTVEDPTYINLTPASYIHKHHTVKQEPEQDYADCFDDLLSWTSKHPEHWSHREVLDWIYYVAEAKKLDGRQVCGESYQGYTGQKLARMSRAQFITIDSHYGAVYYELFQSLLSKASFCEPTPPETIDPDIYPFLDTTFPCLPVPFCLPNEAASISGNQLLSVFVNDSGSTAANIEGNFYDFDITKIDIPVNSESDGGYVSGESDMESCQMRCASPSSVFSLNDGDNNISALDFYKHFPDNTPRPKSGSSEEPDEEMEERPARRRVHAPSKGNHLWEFVRDLLKDPNLNPSLLKWEDKENGIFKFVQSEAVASMWGRKKNNLGMTYEKLSRAMRFCKSAGYFSAVPKNGKFPKKLCFRFGPKAHDWK